MVLETKIWVLGKLIATGVLLLWGPLVCLSKEIYVYSNHITLNISTCNYIYYEAKYEFIFMSPILIQPCLFAYKRSNSKKPGSYHLLFIYLIVNSSIYVQWLEIC